MIDIWSNLSIGVVAGLVATFLSIVLRMSWVAIIVPWYEDRVYKDARIEGRWSAFAKFDDENSDKFTLSLRRQGHRVDGTMVCTEGFDKGREFLVNGTFRNLILTLTYSSIDDTTLDRGTLTLMLVENGDAFRGHVAYYDNIEHTVNACPYECRRENRRSGWVKIK